jgi:uncharacterized ferredoxin-like protein
MNFTLQVVGLDDVEKIGKIAELIFGKEVEFTIRRTESINDPDAFVLLHKKFGVTSKVTQVSCKSSGKLGLKKFLDFLRNYHSEFSLDPTVIEVGAVVINPVLL